MSRSRMALIANGSKTPSDVKLLGCIVGDSLRCTPFVCGDAGSARSVAPHTAFVLECVNEGYVMAEMKLHDFAANETDRGPFIPTKLANNPRAGQWTSERLSQDMVADYKRFLMTDGEGIRCSLYVSGCPFHCKDCFNSSIWDFKAGHEYTQALEDHIIEDLAQPFVQGITYLGGEPLLNTRVLLRLSKRIRSEFGHDKDIWCWTGYTWEELMRPGESQDKMELLSYVDILVDGRYIATLHDSLLQFRGSRNQRILDVPQSLAQGAPVQWSKLHDQERFIPEIYGQERAEGEGKA